MRLNPNLALSRIHALGYNRDSLYLRSGEVMGGTEGLTAEEAAMFIAECEKDERAEFGHIVTRYTYVPGETTEHLPLLPQRIEVSL